jgi:hypothetical protein
MASKPESTHPNAAAFPAGMPGPALRALANGGITSMAQIVGLADAELAAMHGMGPKAIGILRDAVPARSHGGRST